MRFALAIFKYFPFGGIQRDLLKVARECRARGHEVCVFTLMGSRCASCPLSGSTGTRSTSTLPRR